MQTSSLRGGTASTSASQYRFTCTPHRQKPVGDNECCLLAISAGSHQAAMSTQGRLIKTQQPWPYSLKFWIALPLIFPLPQTPPLMQKLIAEYNCTQVLLMDKWKNIWAEITGPWPLEICSNLDSGKCNIIPGKETNVSMISTWWSSSDDHHMEIIETFVDVD